MHSLAQETRGLPQKRDSRKAGEWHRHLWFLPLGTWASEPTMLPGVAGQREPPVVSLNLSQQGVPTGLGNPSAGPEDVRLHG